MNLKAVADKYSAFIVIFFFLAFLWLGLGVYKDYGVFWDEFIQYVVGHVNLRFAAGVDDRLLTFGDHNYLEKYFDPAFEMFLAGVEKARRIPPDDLRAIYFSRHLFVFFMFYAGTIFFYRLCRKQFGHWLPALLGAAFLVLSPRIFAETFYNSKDLPFTAMFTISMFTLSRYLEKKTFPRAFLHALTTGLATDIRVMGVMIVFLTAFLFILDILCDKEKAPRDLRTWGTGVFYILSAAGFIVLFRPILWNSPAYHFIAMLKQFSQFPWEGKVLYLGNTIMAYDVPWHYNFVWIGVTTPVLYLVLFIFGFVFLGTELLRKPKDFYAQNKILFLSLCWVVVPLAGVIALHSVLYDGWRHMYFIYPGMLIIAVAGLKKIFGLFERSLTAKAAGTIALISCLAATAADMARTHPHQYVYFNFLAGKNMRAVKENFDLDYWGLSYRQALEYIVRTDKSPAIKIYAANWPGELNAFLLPPADRKRLEFVRDFRGAKYFISNYREHKEEYPFENEIFAVKFRDAKIMVVYKFI